MKNKPLLITFLFLFGIFIVLYITQATGYYEYKTNKKSTLTEESIKKFENDLKNGKQINIEDYKVKEMDNSNKISNVTLKVSKILEKSLNKIIKVIFKSIANVLEE